MDRYTDPYDVTWTTASDGPDGSMPIGNGDIGLNVWAESKGAIVFYIGKSDAWSGNGRLLKLGRVRVGFAPNPFGNEGFRQRLNLWDGEIEFRGVMPQGGPFMARLWVDAFAPLIHIEIEAPGGVRPSVRLELWRLSPRRLEGRELFSAYGLQQAPYPVIVDPDEVVQASGDELLWYHRNRNSIWRETLELQGLDGFAQEHPDPLLKLTFGGLVRGEDLRKVSPTQLEAPVPLRKSHIVISCLTAQTTAPAEWVRLVRSQADSALATSVDDRRKAHRNWWHSFWQRSYILVSGPPEAEVVTRGYILQRFISACAGRGRFPIKFNGSLFTVDAVEDGERYDADYRRWGGPYWFQNTRLAYWPMLQSGDFDMMEPLFRMYMDALPLARERTRVYFGHRGALFPETMYFWGAYANDNYGWDRKGKPPSYVENTYIRYYYCGMLELLAMMLDYYAYTTDAHFLSAVLVPFASEILAFYCEHYPRDAAGRLVLKPAQALETWQEAVNPLPDIAGLHWVLAGLLSLPRDAVPMHLREQWEDLRAALPDLPQRQINGEAVLAPAAEVLTEPRNVENPELYAVFPFRLFGVGKPGLDLARRTYACRRIKAARGWQHDDVHAAYLGLADEAARLVAQRFSQKHDGSRFPAFWGPNFDWVPDQDHGCNGLIALQAMVLQADGKRILLLPAWPTSWSVRFRLHAPCRTVVEGEFRAGRLATLRVNPSGRSSNVEVVAGKE
ncbi:MAG: hypothetical protein H5T86_08080 [Armatimonadetes bacterium]|nr:hypothetical protein [Armatimonadota bacterium]